MKKIKGIVNWFNDAKGYGYISSPHCDHLFVHYTSIEGVGFKTLSEGQEVEFVIVDGPNGPQAFNVKKIGDVS